MPRPSRHAPTPADLATLDTALAEDARRSADERRLLDQRLAGELGRPSGNRATDTARWLAAMRAVDPELEQTHEHGTAALSLGRSAMVGLGLLLGWGAALGAFYYDGTGRVNVVSVLGLLVGVPALLLLPMILLALPERWLGAVPGGGALGPLLRALSPGRLGFLALRLLPRRWRDHAQALQGRSRAHQTLYAPVQKWLLLQWSQLFALGFQIGALLSALSLILFTDLAFGWSSTLSSGDATLDADRMHSTVETLATPWAWIWEGAVPSAELVETSRYFRLSSDALGSDTAAQLGQWWPFVICAMALYGLLPRVLTALVARGRLRQACGHTWNLAPGMTAVLARLHQARVATSSQEAEHPVAVPGQTAPAETVVAAPGTPGAVINWSAAPLPPGALTSDIADAPAFTAGGAQSVEEDNATLETLAATATEGPVLIVVKSWEPPLLEFTDFVRSIRERLGQGREIHVAPIALGEGTTTLAPPPEPALRLWTRAISALGDPWLSMVELPTSDTAP